MSELPNDTPPTKVLIGKGEPIEALPLRQFRQDYDLLKDPMRHASHPLADGMSEFLNETIVNLDEETFKSLRLKRDPRYPAHNYEAMKIIRPLTEKLVDRKVITGKIIQMVMAHVSRDDMPDYIIKKFDSLDENLMTKKKIDGFDTSYTIHARLQLGSKLANVACGIVISPYTDPEISDIWGFLHRTRVQKFKPQDVTEADAWLATIKESRDREYQMKTHPLHGGSMNPR